MMDDADDADDSAITHWHDPRWDNRYPAGESLLRIDGSIPLAVRRVLWGAASSQDPEYQAFLAGNGMRE